MTPSEVLLKAADTLAERGWCQGGLSDAQGRYCAIGAIRKVTNWSLGKDARSAVHRLMDHIETDQYYGIADWNDAPERTAEDVILAMKRAAEDS